MAGSYKHIVNDDGSFRGVDFLDHMGDAHEALEECYDMIRWLTGGDRDRVAEAWLEGHLKPRREVGRWSVPVTPEEGDRLLREFWKGKAR